MPRAPMTESQRAAFAQRMAEGRAARGIHAHALAPRPTFEQGVAAGERMALVALRATAPAERKPRAKAGVTKRIGRGYDKMTKKRPWLGRALKGGGTVIGVAIAAEGVAQVADTLIPKPVVGAGFILAGGAALVAKMPLVGLPLIGVGLQQLTGSMVTWAQALKADSLPDTSAQQPPSDAQAAA